MLEQISLDSSDSELHEHSVRQAYPSWTCDARTNFARQQRQRTSRTLIGRVMLEQMSLDSSDSEHHEHSVTQAYPSWAYDARKNIARQQRQRTSRTLSETSVF
ncbi:hypothetical protein J6590_024220 [Homalodisca vitripennis]|nr:hypothetical protein J6590_024220 [Homalodisca vitripennis]